MIGGYISVIGNFVHEIKIQKGDMNDYYIYISNYRCKFIINEKIKFVTSAIRKNDNLLWCPTPDMKNISINDFSQFFNYENDKIKLIISEVNGLFDDNYYFLLNIKKLPEIYLIYPDYSLGTIKEGIVIKGNYFENKEDLKVKISYRAYEVLNNSKVFKDFEISVKPIYIDKSTLFIFYPNLDFIKYNFALPVKTTIKVSNNNLEYSISSLELEILPYPRVDNIDPKL